MREVTLMMSLLGELARLPAPQPETGAAMLVQDQQGNVWRETHQEFVRIDFEHPERTGSLSVISYELVSAGSDEVIDSSQRATEDDSASQKFTSWSKMNDLMGSLKGLPSFLPKNGFVLAVFYEMFFKNLFVFVFVPQRT